MWLYLLFKKGKGIFGIKLLTHEEHRSYIPAFAKNITGSFCIMEEVKILITGSFPRHRKKKKKHRLQYLLQGGPQ